MELYSEYVPMLKALSDETRLQIVEMLSCGEMCACNILESFHITQPTLSYHMKILTDCSLVNSRRDGSWINYSANTKQVTTIIEFLDRISNGQQTCICKDTREVIQCD